MLRSLGFVVLSLVASTAFAERTALQKHADFFDGNGNNVVTVPETYDGLRRLGIDPVRSSADFRRAPGAFCCLIHPSRRLLRRLAARVRGKVCPASRRPTCSWRPCGYSARAFLHCLPLRPLENKARYRLHRMRVASPLAADSMVELLRIQWFHPP